MKTQFEWKSREGETCIFEFLEPGKLKLTGYNTTCINITEENNSAKFKKDNPLREMIIVTVNYLNGPYLWLYMDLLDFFVTYEEFLKADYKLICKKIVVNGPETLIFYDKKFITKKGDKESQEVKIKTV